MNDRYKELLIDGIIGTGNQTGEFGLDLEHLGFADSHFDADLGTYVYVFCRHSLSDGIPKDRLLSIYAYAKHLQAGGEVMHRDDWKNLL